MNETNDLEQRVVECVKTNTRSMFEDMKCPGNRGKNFTWGIFPEMASNLAVTVFVAYIDLDNLEDKIKYKQLAKKCALDYATELVGELNNQEVTDE